MLDEDDLEAAAEGIVTPAQVAALRLFVITRRRTAERADEERFRFMRGFNDFFFAVGIVLFGSGVAYFADLDPIMNMLAAAIIWGLAEFMVGRMRLVLPGILLACLFAFFIFRMTRLDWSTSRNSLGCHSTRDRERTPTRIAFLATSSRLSLPEERWPPALPQLLFMRAFACRLRSSSSPAALSCLSR